MNDTTTRLLEAMGGERSEDRVVLDAVPDGWAKFDGKWVPIERISSRLCVTHRTFLLAHQECEPSSPLYREIVDA